MKKVVFALTILLLFPSFAYAEGYYFHEDYLGGSSVVTNEDGEVAAEYEYMPYGELYKETIYDEDFSNSYKFTGQEEDQETGLYYYGARYYGAGVGRFMSQDPAVYDERLFPSDDGFGLIEDPQSLNAYAYVRNNPAKYVDPNGERAYNVTAEFTEFLNTAASEANWYNSTFSTPVKSAIFALSVMGGGHWDIKTSLYQSVSYSLDSVVIGSTEYTKDVLGNVLYGYTGSILGFSEETLKSGAGLNEVFIEGDFNIGHMFSFFDDPNDQTAIELGIQLYETYGDNITEEELISIMQDSELGLDQSRAVDACYDEDDEK